MSRKIIFVLIYHRNKLLDLISHFYLVSQYNDFLIMIFSFLSYVKFMSSNPLT
jgi:hypothetical protein